MTLKELAYTAQQHLQLIAGCPVKRSHVYELLSAAFGYRSWAAFQTDFLLADAGVGSAPNGASAHVIGRAVHLGYSQDPAEVIASALLVFAAERRIATVSWVDIEAARGVATDRLLESPLLLDSLDQAASGGLSPERHFQLAGLCRCKRPNPYLYEESLKGRVLTSLERGWVDDYLRVAPRYERFARNLKAAALGGLRAAAVEYATEFDSREFFELAERLPGEVDAEHMARIASTPEAQDRWTRVAADEGSESALRHLARDGDRSALDRLAERGDMDALRQVTERELAAGDLMQAWTWQQVAVLHGGDLTKSTMQAYHDGGSRDGQFYDSDFGGALYAAGDEAIKLPSLSRDDMKRAKALAREIFDRTP